MNPRVLGIALLFGIPPAVGIALATLRVTAGTAIWLAAVAGLTTAIVLVVGVYLLGSTGHPERVE